MRFPSSRPRRLRQTHSVRMLVRETFLRVEDLIYPIFVSGGSNVKKPVDSMPGICNLSVDNALKEVSDVVDLGIPGVILFGIPDRKDETGSEAQDDNGVVQKAIRAIKGEFPHLTVVSDVCLCQYTDHGHCGIIQDGTVLNDPTLEVLVDVAVSHARAGADMVAPSDMMDGRVASIRASFDREGFPDVAIMAYSAKYASAFYGPFREAASSAPQFGDRQSYQMDTANSREALREVQMDIDEGADIVMVKPALAYMDVIRMVRERFDHPVATYNVSGEYAMVKAAAERGWIDERRVVLESLTGLKRAGADMIITYHAKDVAIWLKER